jgi:hypothetical protein
MGMFDKNSSDKYNNYNKCNCPHCRGGHGINNNLGLDFNNGSQYDVEEEISAIDVDRIDPEDLIEQYIEAVLECECPEEVEEVMYEFFDEVFVHAMQETYISDIEGKIMALNILKDGFISEDE